MEVARYVPTLPLHLEIPKVYFYQKFKYIVYCNNIISNNTDDSNLTFLLNYPYLTNN